MKRLRKVEEEKKTPRSPTQVLIDCMEDFGNDEPTEIVVIYKTQNGDLAWSSNQLENSHFLGMLEMAKFWFLLKCKGETKE
jgi:hypothetical protein